MNVGSNKNFFPDIENIVELALLGYSCTSEQIQCDVNVDLSCRLAMFFDSIQ